MSQNNCDRYAVKRRDMVNLAAYREYLTQHPRLTFLFFELTDACNLSCLHCGSSACPQNKTYLPTDNIYKVMKSVAGRYDPSNIMICLTGGEPMLHPDFFDIVSSAKRLGFSCGVTTNATLISRAAAEQMVTAGIDSVTVSLDGLEASHDWFRNQKGAFQRAVDGIRNLMAATKGRISTQITTVVHKKNMAQLDRMYELVVSLGVDSWRVINLEPMGRALEHPELLLSGRELKDLLEYVRSKRFDPAVSIDVTYGCSHYVTPKYEREIRDTYFLCNSGILVGSVLCNGDIYSCLDIQRRPELVQGNVERDDFVDIWENGFSQFRMDRSTLSSKCRECEDRVLCKGDSTHSWNYDQQEPLLCMKELLFDKEEKNYVLETHSNNTNGR